MGGRFAIDSAMRACFSVVAVYIHYVQVGEIT